MNRYFTKRKAKKPPTAQPKFDMDLTTALPAQDDFRTSLIMNSLSARFSMLREQDDPTSLLGKASDDSVLGPRRQSRLMDFGYSPGRALHDIAEVSSIRSSIRPPFASSNRTDSYFSETGYGTDDDSTYNGSIMNRSRPGEGNSLFGGRQKIYKIPLAGATSEASIASGSSLKGRVLYDDDVSMSTFQRWRKEERERFGNEKDNTGLFADDDSPLKVEQQSPLGGTVTRHASTSTNAASTGRTSTAATSVNSHQGAMSASNTLSMVTATSPPASITSPALDRNASKSRRLYDQILTRDIEEQQTSALTRLNSIQHSKASGGSPTFGRSNSRQGTSASQSIEQPQMSPPQHNPYGLPPFPLTETVIPEDEVSQSQPHSPPRKYSHDPLMSSINPRDRGKATAMGAFNKPQQFNEQQYLERQMSLRSTQRQPYSRVEEVTKPESRAVSINEDRSVSPSVYANSTYSGRSRAPTNASAQEVNFSAFSVFQSAAHQMKSPNTASSDQASVHTVDHGFDFGLSARKAADSPLSMTSSFVIPPLNIAGNSTTKAGSQSRPTTSKSTLDFPTLDPYQPQLPDDQQSRYTPSTIYTSSKHEEPLQSLESLAPANGGLSGLVRQHLRQDSAASSQFDFEDRAAAPRYLGHLTLATKTINKSPSNHDLVTPAESNFSHLSNPFDLEDLKHSSNEHTRSSADHNQSEVKQEESASPRAVRATRRRGMSQAPDTVADIPWTQQLQKSHNRGPSNETIQEQDALANELARRKNAIQERLKAKMEVEQAALSASPVPVQEEKLLGGPFRGLEMLRTKSSRESIRKMTDSIHSTKQSKLFGLPASITPNSERPSFQSDRFRSDEPASGYTPSLRSRSTSRPATSRSVAPPPTKSFTTSGLESSRSSDDFARDRKGSNPPPIAAHNASTRSRSNSVQSNGRSRSRNGRYKDDLERAMVEGSSRVTTQIWPDHPVIPEAELPPMPSLEKLENSQRFTTDVSSTHPNLKIAVNRPSMPATGYFESKGLYPPPQAINSPMSLSSTASSPMMPQHNISPRPSPGLSHMNSLSGKPSPGAYHNMATPPMSGASTPVHNTFATTSHAPPPSSFRSRSLSSKKRSIHKYEIGEPRLISTTSVIDTVALPAGASLMNGMHDIQKAAPPLPTVNPLRQKFGFNTYASPESTQFKPRHRLRKSSSEGAKLGMYLQSQAQSPAMGSVPAFSGRGPRPPMEGGMF